MLIEYRVEAQGSGESPDGNGRLRMKLLWRKLGNICSADNYHFFILALCVFQ